MLAVLLTLLISISFKGDNFWLTPLSEWATTLLYLNFFSIVSFTNEFYSSVHAGDSTLVPNS